jgi:hypothetical protein
MGAGWAQAALAALGAVKQNNAALQSNLRKPVNLGDDSLGVDKPIQPGSGVLDAATGMGMGMAADSLSGGGDKTKSAISGTDDATKKNGWALLNKNKPSWG